MIIDLELEDKIKEL